MTDKNLFIEELQQEVERLKKKLEQYESNEFYNTVKAPDPILGLFNIAEKEVGDYFKTLTIRPESASIEIGGERYVLLRAASLSVNFLKKIQSLYADKGEEQAFNIGRNFLFDIAHVIGIEDAKKVHHELNLETPVEKLSAGPVHFAHTGWANVEILPESTPTPDENFFLKYNHPSSFEADSWISNNIKTKEPVCIMNSGYSSGWCEESFGIPLTAVEISCRARGDEKCTFIMAPPSKIDSYLKKESNSNITQVEIPEFFKRKKQEELLQKSLEDKELLLKEIHHRVKNNLQIISSLINLQSNIYPSENTSFFQQTQNRIKTLALVHEMLYNSTDIKSISLYKYIYNLTELLHQSFFEPNKNIAIRFKTNANDVFIDIDTMIPLGLIINEIVSNAFKHGFTNKINGEIIVKVDNLANQLSIQISNNGNPIPDEVNPLNNKSLGIEVVLTLIDQLKGKLEFTKNPVNFKFEFPLNT